MKRSTITLLTSVIFAGLVSAAAIAANEATPQDVVAKAKEAASVVKTKGDAAIPEFNKKPSPWVFKDTYIFIIDCTTGNMVAHPENAGLVGKNLLGLKDTNGKLFFADMCKIAKSGKSGWVDYMWPKPGEKKASRKVSIILPVESSKYAIGCGIYSDSAKVEDLDKLI